MTDPSQPSPPSPDEWMAAWTKMATDMWGAMGSLWTSTIKAGAGSKEGAPAGRVEEFRVAGGKLWDAAGKAMSEPGFAEMFQKGLQTAPELSMRLFQTGAGGFLELQRRWIDQLQKLGAPMEAYDFNDLDREFLNRWTDLYKKEFRQYLNVPQLGLTRFYQEKLNQTLDKYNLFQAALAEFLHLLSVPMERSFRVMQEKLAELTQAGQFPEDSKQLYQMWIKILEGHFMTLFQSSQYTETMARALETLNHFLAARDEVLEDLFKLLPVCTHRDLDEINREVYLLKKRVRTLEKKLQASDESPGSGASPPKAPREGGSR